MSSSYEIFLVNGFCIFSEKIYVSKYFVLILIVFIIYEQGYTSVNLHGYGAGHFNGRMLTLSK